MLYRTPRLTAAAILRAALARAVGFVAAVGRTGADTAYLDGLNDEALRDIGIRRIETRNDYR